MGHIDHGKTSLLDYLRKSRIIDGEFGGITQHIGAFSVRLTKDAARPVTFVDTPGHAAFKAMRSRGAQTTDIVVLVVDASEGVLEQTLESIRMIREAKTPMVVALNKIDKPTADIEGTLEGLRVAGVVTEQDGGDVQAVPISALKGTNVDKLVEALLTLSEILQLKADFKGVNKMEMPVKPFSRSAIFVGKAEGTVIESSVEKGLGKTATILVQRGAVKVGSVLVSGQSWCKARVLKDDQSKSVKKALPSEAVSVSGWKSVPHAG